MSNLRNHFHDVHTTNPVLKKKTENKNSDQNYWASVSVEHSQVTKMDLLHFCYMTYLELLYTMWLYTIKSLHNSHPSGQRKVAVALLLMGGCYGEEEV